MGLGGWELTLFIKSGNFCSRFSDVTFCARFSNNPVVLMKSREEESVGIVAVIAVAIVAIVALS